MEMYENDILAHPQYEAFFPTYELKYMSLSRKMQASRPGGVCDADPAHQTDKDMLADLYGMKDESEVHCFSPDLLSNSEALLGKRQPFREEGLKRETEMMYSLPDFGRGQTEIDHLDVPVHSMNELDEYGLSDSWLPTDRSFKE